MSEFDELDQEEREAEERKQEALAAQIEERLKRRSAEQAKAARDSNPYNAKADEVWSRALQAGLPEDERQAVHAKLTLGDSAYAEKLVETGEARIKGETDYKVARELYLKNPSDPVNLRNLMDAKARSGRK